MALTPEQQAWEQITRAKRILIASKPHASNDALAAVVACFLFLKKQGKDVDLVVPDFDPSKAPSFLPSIKEIKPQAGAMRSFNITLDVKDVPLGELMYDVRDKKLEITVVPKTGEWSPKDVVFKHGADRYDLVIALDTPDMHSLGSLVREHADFLYRTTVLNIDRDPGNEHWGQINLVDLNAVSTTEVLFHLFEFWSRHQIDEDLATALLAGMIAKTKSFRTPNVTPKTLSVASQLVGMGARREEIVHGLWRTRTVPTLKLWGRALSRLEQDRELGLVWSTLTRQDFVETGAADETLDDVIGELVAYAPDAKVIAFIYETSTPGPACVSIHANPPLSAAELTRPFGANGTRDHASFRLDKDVSITEGTKTVIERLRKTLKAMASDIKGV